MAKNNMRVASNPNVRFKPVATRPSFYKRTNPVRVMPRHNERTSITYKHVSNETRRDLNGKLILPEPEPNTATMAELRRQKEQLDQMQRLSGRLQPQKPEPQVALAGKLKVPTQARQNVSGQLMLNKVEGQLMARSLSGELVDKSLSKFVDKNNPSTLTYGNYDSKYGTGFSANHTLTKSDVNGKVTHRGRNY
jgi:hypothetical protein